VPSREPTSEAQIELQQKIEQHRSFGSNYGPGVYFYWFIAHHFTAADVLFSDVAVDRERTTYNERFGRVFLVTDTALVLAAYENAAEDADGDPQQNFGTGNVQFHARASLGTSLSWPGRSLRVPKNQYGNTPSRVRLPAGALTLRAGELTVSLPGDDADDGDDYVARLRSALWAVTIDRAALGC
jgi:hypothetical protein